VIDMKHHVPQSRTQASPSGLPPHARLIFPAGVRTDRQSLGPETTQAGQANARSKVSLRGLLLGINLRHRLHF
jgi:hypothetical protein